MSAGRAAATFSEEWLSLREPADTAARAPSITRRLAEVLAAASKGTESKSARRTVRFIDSGCGTGANFRYLSPRISSAQEWVLLDVNEELLAAARDRIATRANALEPEHAATALALRRPSTAGPVADDVPRVAAATVRVDLARELERVEITEGAVVTASALLDLVSPEWLARLLERCVSRSAIVLFALSYDGRMALSPSLPDDEWIRQLVNRHQHTDKGFGPALGPDATAFARRRLASLEYEVHVASSDWVLDARSVRLQAELLRGWAAAALEMTAHVEQGWAPAAETVATTEVEANMESVVADAVGTEAAQTGLDARRRCEQWLNTRLELLNRGDSSMRVGHQDLIAWPSSIEL
jgi:SAM-dependent methyltransferase